MSSRGLISTTFGSVHQDALLEGEAAESCVRRRRLHSIYEMSAVASNKLSRLGPGSVSKAERTFVHVLEERC